MSNYRYRDVKNRRDDKSSLGEQVELLDDLIRALVSIRSDSQMAQFLIALMTETEVKVLAKRLRIAQLLIEGKTYQDIAQVLHVGYTTVAKVGGWITDKQNLIHEVLTRLPKKKEFKHRTNFDSWDRFKRSHPLYFWPELLGEDLAKSFEKDRVNRIKKYLGRWAQRTAYERELKEEFGANLRNGSR